MSTYPLHTLASAPEQSRPVLQQLQQAFGMIPNIAATMAESPVLINGFIGVFRQVHSGSFTEAQIQTLLLTNAVTNACPWAVAFHTALPLGRASIRRTSRPSVRGARRRMASTQPFRSWPGR
jgi:hypothetical protein